MTGSMAYAPKANVAQTVKGVGPLVGFHVCSWEDRASELKAVWFESE